MKLVYHVVLTGWTRVNKALKEFKKRKHAGFHIDLEDLGMDTYRLKVFQDRVKGPGPDK